MAKNESFPDKYYADPMGLDRYVVQEKILFEWLAPNKVDRKKQRAEVLQILFVVLIITAILVLAQELLLAAVFLAFIFLYMAFDLMPPVQLRSQLTTIGIKIEDKYYYWPNLSQFWFEERQKTLYLYFRCVFPYIQVVKLIIAPADEEKIKNIIGTYLLYKKPTLGYWQKIVKKFTDTLPANLNF